MIEGDEIDEEEVEKKVFGNILDGGGEVLYVGLGRRDGVRREGKGEVKVSGGMIV